MDCGLLQGFGVTTGSISAFALGHTLAVASDQFSWLPLSISEPGGKGHYKSVTWSVLPHSTGPRRDRVWCRCGKAGSHRIHECPLVGLAGVASP